MDYTWVPDIFPAKHKPEPVKEIQAEPDEPILIGVVQPQTPRALDLTKETVIPPSNASNEESAPTDKEKLRYSDIFPRVDTPGSGGSGSGFAFDEEEEDLPPVIEEDDDEDDISDSEDDEF